MTDANGAERPTVPPAALFVRHRIVRRRRLQHAAVVAIIVLGALAALAGLGLVFSMTRGVFPYR